MDTPGSTPASTDALQVQTRRWARALAGRDEWSLDDRQCIDAITELEELKAAAAAAQARITARLHDARLEAAQTEIAKVEPQAKARRVAEVIRGVTAEVALARRESPARGQQHVGVALALVRDLPHTLAALTAGAISEWRATIVVRETACLSRNDRMTVDRELAADLARLGDRRLGDRARAIGYRLDPGAAIRRTSKATADRRVTCRPAPDTMLSLNALLPVAQGVATYASLRRHAESLHGKGDSRSVAQIMADTLVARVTGQEDAKEPSTPAIEIGLVMSERTLLRGSHEPAYVSGYGSLPAHLARSLVRSADRAWLRRLYAAPETGELVAMDSRRRTFTGKRRALLVLRDQTCRTPWCDAPIRHTDHARAAARGGRTSRTNGQGLCETCNYAKETRGWRVDVMDGPGHVILISTATGHRYRSAAPPLPGADRLRTAEQQLRRILDDTA
jgi:hypothetical protein